MRQAMSCVSNVTLHKSTLLCHNIVYLVRLGKLNQNPLSGVELAISKTDY